MASPGASHRGPGFVDDEANALRGNAAPAAPGLDSRLWPIPPMVGAEPNPGVITDDWILSQVVFDEDAEAPIPAAVLQIEDGPPLEEAEVPQIRCPRRFRLPFHSWRSRSRTGLSIMLLIRSRLNHGPLHGISLTSSSAVDRRLRRLISVGLTLTRVPPFRLEIWIFNPFLMLIGGLSLPEWTDLLMPCLRMSLLRVFLMMEKMTPLKISPPLMLQVRLNPR